MTPQKESAGGYDTTTTDTKTATQTIAPVVRHGQAASRPADMLANSRTDGEIPPPIDMEKQFSTLQAKFAIRGHALHQTNPVGGPATYFAERWGLVRYLETHQDAEQFLAQIGGHHG
jgi:hypothetical protein